MKPREPNLSDRYQRPYGMPVPARMAVTHAFDAAPRSKPRRVRRGAGSRPNAALTAEYRKRIEFLVLSMHASVLYWMRAAYRQNTPIMAQDKSDVERCLDGGGNARNHIACLEDGANAKAMMLLSEARRYDRMGYSLGLRDVRITPDRDKWHSFYDFGRDQIITEGKFWRERPAERLHMMLHEVGHRGQDADRAGYEEFKRRHLSGLQNFRAMANTVHLQDESAGHLHDLAEEVWAESYARWCLGLPMPDELKEFWNDRCRLGGHRRVSDGICHERADRTLVDEPFGLDMAMGCRTPEGPIRRAGNERNKRDVGGSGNRRAAIGTDSADMAMDRRTPADHLRSAFARLRKRWEERFDDAASKLARWFAQSAATRSDERLRRILKDGGLSVRFTPTKAMRDVQAATVQANVALIKSIPQQYLTQVEGYVMRSVQTGRDLHQLSRDLQEELGVTKRRAAFIALDQNNKANAAMTRARQIELGIKQAIWMHSHAGKCKRKTHVANDGHPYDVNRGWFDPDPKVQKRIFPGTLPRCRCFSRPVIEGFKP